MHVKATVLTSLAATNAKLEKRCQIVSKVRLLFFLLISLNMGLLLSQYIIIRESVSVKLIVFMFQTVRQVLTASTVRIRVVNTAVFLTNVTE